VYFNHFRQKRNYRRNGGSHIAVVFFLYVICQQIQRPAAKIRGCIRLGPHHGLNGLHEFSLIHIILLANIPDTSVSPATKVDSRLLKHRSGAVVFGYQFAYYLVMCYFHI
jgi:hypothetical protein